MSQNKTEKPTAKRLRDERKKGNVAISKEFSTFIMLLSYSLIIFFLLPKILMNISKYYMNYMSHICDIHGIEIYTISVSLFQKVFSNLVISVCIVIFFAISTSILQNGFILSFNAIKPNFSKVSVFKGIKKMFSSRVIKEFFISFLKLVFCIFFAYTYLFKEIRIISQFSSFEIIFSIQMFFKILKKILILIMIFMFFVAIFDLLYSKKKYIDELKMTKQEVKDEYKQQETNAEVKNKRRQKHIGLTKNILKKIKDVDLLIMNPTHYAVGLEYKHLKTPAPIVVIRCEGSMALMVKKIALFRNIPTVEDPILAQAIYKSCKIGSYIKEEHYVAVAKIIKDIFAKQGKKFV